MLAVRGGEGGGVAHGEPGALDGLLGVLRSGVELVPGILDTLLGETGKLSSWADDIFGIVRQNLPDVLMLLLLSIMFIASGMMCSCRDEQ